MKILEGFNKNSRYCILVEPLWAVFGGVIGFYAPLYMKELGLDAAQIGLVGTVYMIFSFIGFIMAAPITNRLGRKKTTLYFDLLSWSVPMLIWAFSNNIWHFLIAAVLNATVRIVYTSWFLLFSEDAEESLLPKIFGIIYLINYTSGIFAPLAGLLIKGFGIIPVMRIVYGIGFISMTIMFLLRNMLVTETTNGVKMMEEYRNKPLFQFMDGYFKSFGKLFTNKARFCITMIFAISNFLMAMSFIQVIYFTGQWKYNEAVISAVPLAGAVISLFVYFVVLPRLNRESIPLSISLSFLFMAAAVLLFILLPGNRLWMLILSTGLFTVGNMLVQTYRDTLFMGFTEESEKADMFSAIQTVTTLICIPAGYLTGIMYGISPVLPFYTMLFLILVAFLFSLLLKHKNNR